MDAQPDEPPGDPWLAREVRQVGRLGTYSLVVGVVAFALVFLEPGILPVIVAVPSLTSAIWARRRATALPDPPTAVVRAEIGLAVAISAILLDVGAVVVSSLV